MSKTATVRARIEPTLKHEVEDVLHTLGLSTTEAINLFFTQVKLRHALPFEVAIPNKTTEQTFQDTDKGNNLTRHTSVDTLFDDLEI